MATSEMTASALAPGRTNSRPENLIVIDPQTAIRHLLRLGSRDKRRPVGVETRSVLQGADGLCHRFSGTPVLSIHPHGRTVRIPQI